MSGEIENTLTTRGKTHGEFADNASIAGDLRGVMRNAPNWAHMTPEQQLALEEIALKIARLLSKGANVFEKEHWHDIEGYARLGGRQCS